MPSIDELLGMDVATLEALTDDQLLERYADIFNLEPQVPVEDSKDNDEEGISGDESISTTRPRRNKKANDNKAKIADLKNKLMEASKQGLSKDEAFDKLFDL